MQATPTKMTDGGDLRNRVGAFGVWQARRVEPNRRMIQSFCDELAAQEVIGRPVTVDELFGEFTSLYTTAPSTL